MPTILAMQCNNENTCAGLGDRLISLGSAFWLVRRSSPCLSHACTHLATLVASSTGMRGISGQVEGGLGLKIG